MTEIKKRKKKRLKSCIDFFPQKRTPSPLISDENYYERFGIKKIDNIYQITDTKKLEAAYEKAWENRNYEIDKSWTRALYFWGFIAAAFIAYTALITSEKNGIITAMHIDLLVIAMGIIFSIAWLLVIKGSKQWQENWEKHIDYLEDFISGRIHKTVLYSGKSHYSVSKLNKTMAFTVLLVWGTLFIQTLYNQLINFNNLHNFDLILIITIVIVTLGIIFVMLYGYCVTDIYSKEGKGFIDREVRDYIKKEGKVTDEEIKKITIKTIVKQEPYK